MWRIAYPLGSRPCAQRCTCYMHHMICDQIYLSTSLHILSMQIWSSHICRWTKRCRWNGMGPLNWGMVRVWTILDPQQKMAQDRDGAHASKTGFCNTFLTTVNHIVLSLCGMIVPIANGHNFVLSCYLNLQIISPCILHNKYVYLHAHNLRYAHAHCLAGSHTSLVRLGYYRVNGWDMESHEEVRKVRVLVIGESELVNRLINKFTCVGEERATTIATIGILPDNALPNLGTVNTFFYCIATDQITRYGCPV